jgi:hypothetical protein
MTSRPSDTERHWLTTHGWTAREASMWDEGVEGWRWDAPAEELARFDGWWANHGEISGEIIEPGSWQEAPAIHCDLLRYAQEALREQHDVELRRCQEHNACPTPTKCLARDRCLSPRSAER